MCVYLGGRDTLMTKHLLHLTYARSALQEVSCKRMTKGVWTYRLVDACTLGSLLDNREDHHSGQSLAPIVEKEGVVIATLVVLVVLVVLFLQMELLSLLRMEDALRIVFKPTRLNHL